MRGRVQATVVALLGSWVPLLSPATVGLVTLRLGYQQGIWIFAAAILPALIAQHGDGKCNRINVLLVGRFRLLLVDAAICNTAITQRCRRGALVL